MVRSLASAAEVSYKVAHDFCKNVLKRENRKGTQNVMITSTFLKAEEKGLQLGDKKFDVTVLGKRDIKNRYKIKGEVIWRQKTLKSFIETHRKGTYLVMVAKHALTIKDGEVLDWGSNAFLPTRKVQAAYRLKEQKTSAGRQLSLFE